MSRNENEALRAVSKTFSDDLKKKQEAVPHLMFCPVFQHLDHQRFVLKHYKQLYLAVHIT